MLDKGKGFVVLYTSCRREGDKRRAEAREKQIKNRIRKKWELFDKQQMKVISVNFKKNKKYLKK